MNRKVLIVEDNKDLARLMSYHLMSAHLVPYMAATGYQGLDVLAEVKPDLIITDIIMPEMTGYEFCKKLDEKGLLQKIPVIVLTAYAKGFEEFHELGIQKFLLKPFEPNKLLEVIEQVFHKIDASQP